MLHKYKERIRKGSKRNFNLRSGKKAYFYLFTKYPFYYYYNFSTTSKRPVTMSFYQNQTLHIKQS